MDKYAIGDYLVDSSNIYKIVDIRNGTDFKGKECVLVHYKPVWKSDSAYMGSIPLNNISKTGMRKVLSKKEIKVIIDSLPKNEGLENVDINSAREKIYQNDPESVAIVLKIFWLNRGNPNRGDKDLMENIIDNLGREVAFVNKIKFGKAKSVIVNSLEKLR
jgi:RNA polymerase-interacting CarD/CdnL/TRCF family regulator